MHESMKCSGTRRTSVCLPVVCSLTVPQPADRHPAFFEFISFQIPVPSFELSGLLAFLPSAIWRSLVTLCCLSVPGGSRQPAPGSARYSIGRPGHEPGRPAGRREAARWRSWLHILAPRYLCACCNIRQALLGSCPGCTDVRKYHAEFLMHGDPIALHARTGLPRSV